MVRGANLKLSMIGAYGATH